MTHPSRSHERQADELRPIRITRQVLKHPAGSALIEWGDTRVLCAATIEDRVPPWLMGISPPQGWVTAEYAMLPGATNTRTQRERKGISGRSQEIQRLIGRSLRAITDLAALGHRTITVDCDVLQADGGTRTAAISGAFAALYEALQVLVGNGALPSLPLRDQVAALSAGLVGERVLLDLDYNEDSQAAVDMNFVLTGTGRFVEVQGTAEQEPFSQEDLDHMCRLARQGAQSLFALQRQVLGLPEVPAATVR